MWVCIYDQAAEAAGYSEGIICVEPIGSLLAAFWPLLNEHNIHYAK